ncbi:hypothetical protein EJ02DRAFT_493510 [Clathrospora elynae]|uniref:Uncharacterized protein n=1 Tax=Clathrospora elynae TaxID=706981 RepID=A0A6A5SQN7_9PLEO|nr:hypothetical protein EJ02DRAFT_493510 [Clathrospora elynae]
MTNVPNRATIIAWISFLSLLLRSVSVCTFVFLSVNLNVLRIATIQVQAKDEAIPSARRLRSSGSKASEPEGESAPPNRRSHANTTQTPQQPSAQPSNRAQQPVAQLTPHSYSFRPPESDSKHQSQGSIIELYEAIIASDSQTIQVQQQTMVSQQDIIHTQTQMIAKLRYVLEEQDARMEELEDAARGLRVRRAAPRSRSS